MVTATQNTDAAAIYSAINAASSGAGKKASSSGSTVQDTQDRFLKLLVTQMKNQDPLNPMDNAQVTSQMAQLSTVSGLDKVNATLQALSESMVGGQALQATTMIGHGVLLEGKSIELQKGQGLAGIDLPQAAGQVSVSIYDKAGALVRNMDLNAKPAGIQGWTWDGKDNAGKVMDDGNYTFTVTAASSVQDGTKLDVTALQYGLVNSVTQNKDGVSLGVGKLDGVTMSQIRKIL